jgi:pimeloyl-ACP methyl ester carboxylesterase
MAYVLVHGGGFAASCWDPLVPLLDGEVRAVDLPGRGRRPAELDSITIDDFAAAVVEDMDAAGLDDVVLVGHSLAGVTLPPVMALVPERLRHVVFVSCAVPPAGTTVADALTGLSPTAAELAASLGDQLVDEHGRLHDALATAMFCNDMDDELTRQTLDRMTTEAPGVISEPVDLTGLRRPVPRTYVRLLQDQSIDLPAQDRMIATLREAGEQEVGVVDLDAAHMAMLSAPARLAAVLAALAAAR